VKYFCGLLLMIIITLLLLCFIGCSQTNSYREEFLTNNTKNYEKHNNDNLKMQDFSLMSAHSVLSEHKNSNDKFIKIKLSTSSCDTYQSNITKEYTDIQSIEKITYLLSQIIIEERAALDEGPGLKMIYEILTENGKNYVYSFYDDCFCGKDGYYLVKNIELLKQSEFWLLSE